MERGLQSGLQPGEAEQRDAGLRQEVDQNVNIAFGSEVIAKNRSEERELPHAVPPAKVGDRLHGDGYTGRLPGALH